MKTAEQIAQFVIDNRYPKSENDKISDAEMYHAIVEQIASLRVAEANKWVSVKDRLPQENKLVQCSSVRTHMGGETRQETCMGRLINANHPRFSCDVDWVKTTHWKELDEFVLPKPPTETP